MIRIIELLLDADSDVPTDLSYFEMPFHEPKAWSALEAEGSNLINLLLDDDWQFQLLQLADEAWGTSISINQDVELPDPVSIHSVMDDIERGVDALAVLDVDSHFYGDIQSSLLSIEDVLGPQSSVRDQLDSVGLDQLDTFSSDLPFDSLNGQASQFEPEFEHPADTSPALSSEDSNLDAILEALAVSGAAEGFDLTELNQIEQQQAEQRYQEARDEQDRLQDDLRQDDLDRDLQEDCIADQLDHGDEMLGRSYEDHSYNDAHWDSGSADYGSCDPSMDY